MKRIILLSFLGVAACGIVVHACCPAGRDKQSVLNADQTVVILWDPVSKTQHFIRKASFKSDGDDFGFLIPSPTQPQLDESGDAAFDLLRAMTRPEIQYRKVPRRPRNLDAKSPAKSEPKKSDVKVLEQKVVAGFKASVLEASSAKALVEWLEKNGYAFSPAVEAWAKPYIDEGWKITALKVSKDAQAKQRTDVGAPALRMSFQTDQPLFPYREPDTFSAADALGARHRTLRIFFIGDARYSGKLAEVQPWTGRAVWSGQVSADASAKVLEHLKLPPGTGAAQWWLTEFEDNWPYRPAPGDLIFTRSADQSELRRPPIVIDIEEDEPAAPALLIATTNAWIYGTAVAILVLSLAAVLLVLAWFRSRRT